MPEPLPRDLSAHLAIGSIEKNGVQMRIPAVGSERYPEEQEHDDAGQAKVVRHRLAEHSRGERERDPQYRRVVKGEEV